MDYDDRPVSAYTRWLPVQFKERCAFLLILSLFPIIILFEMYLVIPKTGFDMPWQLHMFMICFLAQNIYGNLLKIMTIDASGRQFELPHILKPNWTYCYICKLNAPPRAYHCHICNACVLKRDHHSSFTGRCIGYHNHRYYMWSVVYCFIAAAYATVLHWEYCWQVLGGLHLLSLFYLVMPQFALLLRFLSLWQFFHALLLMSTLFMLAMSIYLLAVQLFTVSRGVTLHERNFRCRCHTTAADHHHQHRNAAELINYDRGSVIENWKVVLGHRWYLTWLSAFVPSPLESDGLSFDRYASSNQTGGGFKHM